MAIYNEKHEEALVIGITRIYAQEFRKNAGKLAKKSEVSPKKNY